MSVRIKVCGIREVEDAQAAIDAGADLIGLNFVPGSPRALQLDHASVIADAVAGQIERVGIFRDPEPELIERVLRQVELERIQFHGDETPDEVEEVDLPVIKALRGADLEAAEKYPGAVLLLDHPTSGGGQGQSWNWSDATELLAAGFDVILAGGLDASNVGAALADLGDLLPWGVDVATGVEGEAFRKDPKKIKSFITAVRQLEQAGEE